MAAGDLGGVLDDLVRRLQALAAWSSQLKRSVQDPRFELLLVNVEGAVNRTLSY